MPGKVLVTEPIHDDVLNYLREKTNLTVGKRGEYNSKDTLITAVKQYDAILSMLSNPFSRDVLEEAGSLKIVANYAVGYDNIDVAAAKEFGIRVSNTPGVLTDATADLAMSLLLTVARKVCESQQHLRDGKFDGWHPLGFLGMELKGKNIGIIGMGRIGRAIAKRARAFGLNIHYHNRKPVDSSVEQSVDATYEPDTKKMVRHSDILVLACPLTPETRHLINAETLDMMPNHALIINISRGPVVDEAALAKALHQGIIGGAGLDVFEEEPIVHPDLLKAPNTVITPHIGSAAKEARRAMGLLAANAILDILDGKPAESISNLVI
ncbi:MAG TPA: D-glycerate dehydrogenase [Balneolales bacterium]|nr:D-glycerate dehydrogenase [Balneolales bacterium]